MPLPNRVTPEGELAVDPARGLFMGNRGGRIHDPTTRTLGTARWKSKAWICCSLSFKGWHRNVWGGAIPSSSSATSRPRSPPAIAPAWNAAAPTHSTGAMPWFGISTCRETPRFPELDLRLHAERLDGRAKRTHALDADTLPDGAMLQTDVGVLAIRGDVALPGGRTATDMPCPAPGASSPC